MTFCVTENQEMIYHILEKENTRTTAHQLTFFYAEVHVELIKKAYAIHVLQYTWMCRDTLSILEQHTHLGKQITLI